MSFEPGRSLLHFRIVEQIGEGGMGAVWRAVDTSLDRDVAIKVLPEAFARDADRLARFEREAKMLAALSHPGIAAVHSVHDVEGVRFLAMELVPGEDLEQRLGRDALSVDEALEVARQLADALAAAHERGVIHRDLKPANIRITPEGRVKVLDLGLAKALDPAGEPEAAGPGLSRSPTVTSGGTMAGVILGTAAYMSPEQAKGAAVDRRTDVWAFGVVLFEMLTGRRLFEGATVSEVIASVLRADIDLGGLPRDTPAGVRRLLERCLRRDPKGRLRDMGDARLDLEPEADGPVPVAGERPRSRSLAVFAALLTVMVVVGLAAAWLADRVGEPAPAPLIRFGLYQIGMPIDAFQGLAISPDGQHLVFRARDADGLELLHVRSMDDHEIRALPGTELGWLPFFSPDGRQVGFYTLGGLKTIALSGGTPRTIASISSGYAGGVWLPDDSIVFTSTTGSKLRRVPAAGGEIEDLEIRAEDPDWAVASPSLLPGGGDLLLNVGSGATFDVAVYGLDDGSLQVIAENGFTPTWSASGHVIYQQGSDGPLMALPYDPGSRRPTGSAFPVEDDIGTRVSYQVRMFALAGNGTLAYIPDSTLLDSGALEWVDLQGRATSIVEVGRVVSEPRLSHDGRRIAFRTPAPQCDIWVHDLERGTTSRISRDGDNHGVAWSPDDGRLATSRLQGADWGVVSLSSDGAGEPASLAPAVFPRGFVLAYTADGGSILVASEREETGADVDLVAVKDGSIRSLLGSRFDEGSISLSPDGRHVAYVSNDSGRFEVYVSPFPGMDARTQISTDGGTEPVWSRDGAALFFRSGRRMLVADVALGPELSAGRPRELFASDHVSAGPANVPDYDVSPDGQRLVMVRQRSGAAGAEVHIVTGWGTALGERAGGTR